MLTFHTGMTLCKKTCDLSSRFPLHGSNVAQGHALGSRNRIQKGDQWSAFQLDARGCVQAREEQEGWFYSTSIQLRVPLRVVARRSAWAERHNEVRSAFSLMLIPPDKPTFSHSSPRRILAILDWDFGGSHALQFTDRGFEVCWPDLDDVDVRIKDAEEIGRFQTLIDQLAGALPVNVKLNQLVCFPRGGTSLTRKPWNHILELVLVLIIPEMECQWFGSSSLLHPLPPIWSLNKDFERREMLHLFRLWLVYVRFKTQ